MIDQLQRLLRPLSRRIMSLVVRAEIQDTMDDKALQRIKLEALKDDIIDGIEMVGLYGFESRPKDAAEAVVLFLNGDRSHGIVIGTEDRRYRLKGLVKGEAAQYTDEGCYVWLKRNKKFEARSDTFKFQGATNELMDQLVQLTTQVKTLADTLNTTTTNTTLGPMKLNEFAAFGTIKTAVTTIETALTGLKGT